MQIATNKVVKFHYQLSEPEGPVFEDSREVGQEMFYLHGHGGLVPGLEDAFEGKSAGESFSVVLPPEKAYGERQRDAIQRVSMKHVITESKKKVHFKTGMVVQVNTEHGPEFVTVLKVGLKTLDVDTNHPLAGLTLKYDVEVLDVRDATPEEIDHGHVHGEGGVNH